MKDVEFLKDHGTIEKGTVKSYHDTTAKALEAHKLVKVIGDTKIIEVKKDGLAMKVQETK